MTGKFACPTAPFILALNDGSTLQAHIQAKLMLVTGHFQHFVNYIDVMKLCLNVFKLLYTYILYIALRLTSEIKKKV